MVSTGRFIKGQGVPLPLKKIKRFRRSTMVYALLKEAESFYKEFSAKYWESSPSIALSNLKNAYQKAELAHDKATKIKIEKFESTKARQIKDFIEDLKDIKRDINLVISDMQERGVEGLARDPEHPFQNLQTRLGVAKVLAKDLNI